MTVDRLVEDGLRRGLQLRDRGSGLSPLELARLVFPWPWADYQVRILEHLLAGDWQRLLILAPPRHRKTSILAFYCAWTLGERPATRIMVASHSRDFSVLVMDQIEAILRLPAFRRQFGQLVPSGRDRSRWTTNERHISGKPPAVKDPSLLALSPESGTIGYGADLIVVDDLVTPANSFTPGARNRLHMWFYSSLLHRLEPDGRIVVAGARWFSDDLYGVLLREKWPALIFRASPEQPLWPEHWPAEALLEQAQRDPVFFSAQYLQEPQDLTRAVLNPNWFRFYLETPSAMSVVCGLDQAVTGRGSKFAYVVVGRDLEGKVYVLDVYSGFHPASELPGLLESIYDRWRPEAFAWESSGTQGGEAELLNLILNRPINLVPMPSVLSKEVRTLSIAGLVRTGQVLIPGTFTREGTLAPLDSVAPLVEAWRLFPGGDQDLLDAFEKAVNLARRGPAAAVSTSVTRPVTPRLLRFPRLFHYEFGVQDDD